MPLLRNAATGNLELVADSQVQAALQAGTHSIDQSNPVQASALQAQGGVTSPDQLQALSRPGVAAQVVQDATVGGQESSAYESERFGGAGESLAAGLTGALDAATLGGFSAVNRATQDDDALARSVREHRGAYTVGQIAGTIATARPGGAALLTPAGQAARLGRALGTAGEGVGGLGRLAIGAGGLAAEGAIQGAGMGVAELAISEDPLTMERAVSALSSGALLGGVMGGGVGVIGKAAEKGLARASMAVKEAKAASEAAVASRAAGEVTADLAGLDARGLRAARDAELARIEAERVPLRASIAEDFAAARQAAKAEKPWIALEGFKGKARGKGGAFDAPAQAPPPRNFQPTGRDAGGTNGAKWFTDETGQEWVGKAYKGAHADERLAADHLVGQLYREFGVGVPETQIADVAGKPTLMSRKVEGAAGLDALKGSDAERGFIVDAWLGNRDVAGLDLDNMLVKDGVAHRIDTGGGLFHSADGRPKRFDDDVSELTMLRRPSYPDDPIETYSAGKVFGHLSDADVLKQIDEFERTYAAKRSAIDDLVAKSKLPPAEAERVRQQLHARAKWIVTEGRRELGGAPLGGLRSAEPIKPEQIKATQKEWNEAAQLTAEDQDHIKWYHRDRWSYDINEKLRGRGGALDEEQQEVIDGVNNILSRPSTQIPHDVVVYRGVRRGAAFPNVGDSLVDEAPMFTTMKRDIIDNHGYAGKPGESFSVEIELPKGTNALALDDFQSSVLLPGRLPLRVTSVDPEKRLVRATLFPAEEAASTAAAPRLAVVAGDLAPKVAPVPAELAREFREIGKISFEADRAIDRMLRNPKRLAQNPSLIEGPLQQQEHALERLQAVEPELRARLAADPSSSGAREAALDTLAASLERNRALQARLQEVAAKPATTRLQAIQAAHDDLISGGTRGRGLPEQLLQGAVFAGATSVASPLGIGAPIVGAKVAQAVSRMVFGRLAKASGEAAARTTRAVDALLTAGKKVAPVARPAATKVLTMLSFAPPDRKEPAKPRGLVEAYQAREREVLSQVEAGPDGAPVMRMAARRAVAERLSGVAAVSPQVADQIETHAARRIEHLAAKLPKPPDLGVMQIGPDTWHPSDLDIRTWARIAAAVDDPGAVEERLAAGTIVPEEAEAYRAVYPERFEDLRRQVIERLPELRQSLPFERRLALSIFTGVPIDPSLSPPILRVMQGIYAEEPGTEEGTQAPRAAPQFGSMSREQPTPAQKRSE